MESTVEKQTSKAEKQDIVKEKLQKQLIISGYRMKRGNNVKWKEYVNRKDKEGKEKKKRWYCITNVGTVYQRRV